jgi:gas vesicle protein
MKKSKLKKGACPVAAAVVGAAVGAGAVLLSNKDNQEKIKKAYNNARDKVTDYIESEKEMVEEKIAEGKDKTENTVGVVKGVKNKIKRIWQK